jgi:hypothetical protein
MNLEAEQPGWPFYLGWIAFSTLAILLAFGGAFPVLALATDWIGDWITVDGQKHITEDYLFSFVFPVLIWLFTSGLQFALLRRYLPKMGGWILATGVGWLFAVTLGYLDRVFLVKFGLVLTFGNIDPKWTIFLSFIGASIGFFQWLLLRRSLPRAAWWILASVLGWGLIDPVVGLPFTGFFDILAIGFFPGLITAICLWFLFRQEADESQQLIGGIEAEI